MKTSTSPFVLTLSRSNRMVDAGRGVTASAGISVVPKSRDKTLFAVIASQRVARMRAR
jgi:hypothetical protein